MPMPPAWMLFTVGTCEARMQPLRGLSVTPCCRRNDIQRRFTPAMVSGGPASRESAKPIMPLTVRLLV